MVYRLFRYVSGTSQVDDAGSAYGSRAVPGGSCGAYGRRLTMAQESLQTRFGRRCRALRTKRGLSQLDMVSWHGWELSHYQRIERGDLDVKLSTMARLAKAFGVTLATLMRGL